MRFVNRVLASILAVGLIVVCVAIVVESVAALIDRGPAVLPLDRWDGWWADRTWDDGVITVVLICLGIGGLLLLIFESWKRRPQVLEIEAVASEAAAEGGTRRIVVGRKGLEDHVEMIVERIDGVLSASTRAHRRRMAVDVMTSATNKNVTSLRERVEAAAEHELDALGLQRHLRVGVDVTRAKQRVR